MVGFLDAGVTVAVVANSLEEQVSGKAQDGKPWVTCWHLKVCDSECLDAKAARHAREEGFSGGSDF
ncbi:hypothetical protein CTRI78_v002123 [Colletotrichum trifolii]|uniref:Uncharacterized protein n=1 Tax=Colletotrichum trifolii TaxID=5466 RepID=A0A4R8RUX7_COLTR|nr:hypothetical protein CTRI78_v002123 [Colletotrichum trifolii]